FDEVPRLDPAVDHRELVVGPNILDLDGRALDQDRDLNPAEPIEDRYTFRFGTGQDIVAPQIDDLIFEFLHEAEASLQRIQALDFIFSEPPDPTHAGDFANYSLSTAGRDHRFGTRDDRVIPLLSAVYDADARMLKLTPATPLSQNQLFRIT